MVYISDDEFIRGKCPMTKEEIRILSIARLGLESSYRVLDVGAGTGSVSIQAALICSCGEVVAVEKDQEALDTLYKNIEKFNTKNIRVIEGEAPEALIKESEIFDAVFIGGSGGNIEEIIKTCISKLRVGGNIVLNFITVDNMCRAVKVLRELEIKAECIQVSVNRAKGSSLMLMASNSIFIVSGRK
jgi:cobalt-precorrin-6B (C15)-methyltransferase